MIGHEHQPTELASGILMDAPTLRRELQWEQKQSQLLREEFMNFFSAHGVDCYR